MSPQLRRAIGIGACLWGAITPALNWSKGYGIGVRPFALIVVGAIFLILVKRVGLISKLQSVISNHHV